MIVTLRDGRSFEYIRAKNSEEKKPVILAFRGSGPNKGVAKFKEKSQLNKLAESGFCNIAWMIPKHDFRHAYGFLPWILKDCYSKNEDMSYVGRVFSKVVSFGIDHTQIFAWGWSAGANFCHLLASQFSFSAIVSVSAAGKIPLIKEPVRLPRAAYVLLGEKDCFARLMGRRQLEKIEDFYELRNTLVKIDSSYKGLGHAWPPEMNRTFLKFCVENKGRIKCPSMTV